MAIQIQVPRSVRTMALLDRCSYEDAFSVRASRELPPGAWARLAIDSAPAALLVFVRFAQAKLLGLRLEPADPAHPLGWTILRDDDEAFVLGAEGPGGAARLVGSAPAGLVVMATQARFDARQSRVLWRLLAPLHRRIARYLLDRAVQRARGI